MKGSSGLFDSQLTKLFLLIWTLRFAINLAIYLAGSQGVEIPLKEFVIAQLWQLGELLLLTILFYFLIKLHPVHFLLTPSLLILAIIMVALAIIDPIVVALAGDHLTPSLLGHFAGPRIFLTDELWLPVKSNWILVLPGLLILVGLIILLYFFVRHAMSQTLKAKFNQLFLFFCITVLLLFIPYFVESRFLVYPPEINFIRNAMGWDLYKPREKDIKSLQDWLTQPGHTWIDNNHYPLIRKADIREMTKPKPNIILFVIESLRGSDCKLFDPKGQIELPGLEAFARRSLVFPYFISNGFPSTEGFTSISMGIWPHGKDRIAISHQDKNFPSMAMALRKEGYETYRIEDIKDMEEEGYWIQSTFDHHITFADQDLFPSEKNMVDTLKNIISNHSNPLSKPFFIHLKTRNPHYPYEIADDENKQFYQRGTPDKNYPLSLKHVDQSLTDLYLFLERKGLFENTVIFITGDHSNYTDKLHMTSLPTDETVWTGAILAGPQSIIGKPDTIVEHASQVDISTTLLNMAGSSADWMFFGRDLLIRRPIQETCSVAIRPAGIRLDHAGGTFLVNRSNPSTFITYSSFDGQLSATEIQPPITPVQLLNMVDTWTWLIEEDRVFYELDSAY